MNFAKTYAANTDLIFNGITPVAIESPVVTIITPAVGSWVHGTVNVTASVQDYTGISSNSVTIDSTILPITAQNLLAPLFPIDTTKYSDGPHTLTVTATNLVGMSTAVTTPVKVDNTAPTIGPVSISGAAPVGGTNTVSCTVAGTISDAMSGPTATLDATWGGNTNPVTITNGAYSTSKALDNVTYSLNPISLTLLAHDVAGNVSSSTYSVILYCSQPGRGCGAYACKLQ